MRGAGTFLSGYAMTGCLIVGTALSVPAFAQGSNAAAPAEAAASASTPTVYLPASFANFQPRSALDMVERIPDFTLQEVSDDRGIGQASENILVNGERVTGKGNDARSVLRQIAASAVERIEVVDGATLGIPGLTGRVANVIVNSGGVAGQFRYEAQFRRNIEDQISTGSVSINGRIGASDFTLSLDNNGGIRRGGVGPIIRTDATGALLQRTEETASFHDDEPRLAGTLRRQWADGSILNLNLAGQLGFFTGRFAGAVTPRTGPVFDELFRATEDEWNTEAGADYEFALGGGRLKLIALQSFERSDVTNTYTSLNRVPGAVIFGQRLQRDSDEGESVLRGEYSWQTAGGDSWQAAIEGAYNFLDIAAALGRRQNDGSYVFSPLPGGTTFVDEWRMDANLTRGWRLAPGLRLQTTIAGEYSRIRQTGMNGLSRSFLRPKGSAALTWTASPRLTVNASVERRVGQLSFFDFSSMVDLRNDIGTGGNVQLVPEQSWRFDAEATRSLGPSGSLTLGGYAEFITDIVDRVPLSATEEGIGNLPSARRWGVIARGTLLLDALGWRGARIDANAEFRDSSVLDPVTGRNRRISEDLDRNWGINFRHDIPASDIAWGATIQESIEGPEFRLDQVRQSPLNRPITFIYVEHKDLFGLTVRLTVRNLNDTRDDIRRTVYVDRRDGPVAFNERQLRRIYLIGVLTISGSF